MHTTFGLTPEHLAALQGLGFVLAGGAAAKLTDFYHLRRATASLYTPNDADFFFSPGHASALDRSVGPVEPRSIRLQRWLEEQGFLLGQHTGFALTFRKRPTCTVRPVASAPQADAPWKFGEVAPAQAQSGVGTQRQTYAPIQIIVVEFEEVAAEDRWMGPDGITPVWDRFDLTVCRAQVGVVPSEIVVIFDPRLETDRKSGVVRFAREPDDPRVAFRRLVKYAKKGFGITGKTMDGLFLAAARIQLKAMESGQRGLLQVANPSEDADYAQGSAMPPPVPMGTFYFDQE
ncbi:hypothetical protein [Thiomonas sp.]